MDDTITYKEVLNLIRESAIINRQMIEDCRKENEKRWRKIEEEKIKEEKIRIKEYEKRWRKIEEENIKEEKIRKEEEKIRIKEYEKRWRKIEEEKIKEEKIRKEEFNKYQLENKKSWAKSKQEMQVFQDEFSGIGKSNDEFDEDFFYNSLQKNMKLLDIEIDEIEKIANKLRMDINVSGKYDIILTNADVVILVEVKYKFRAKDVKKLVEKQIPNYKILFPEKSHYKIRGAIAGFTFENKAIELAKQYGLFVLTQSGENIKVMQNATKIY